MEHTFRTYIITLVFLPALLNAHLEKPNFYFFQELIIDVPINHIEHADACTLIPAKIITYEGQTEALIACSYWLQLELTSHEIALGRFNLLNHLTELIPDFNAGIACVLAGNGIQTKYRDFGYFSHSIREKIPEAPLFISVFNPTEGIQRDLARALQEFDNIENTSIIHTREVIATLSEKLAQINPEALLLYIAHSEGGGIFSCATNSMTPTQRLAIKHNLFFLGFGPTIPIPKKRVYNALNIYSDKDILTFPFASPFLANPSYFIHITTCITPS